MSWSPAQDGPCKSVRQITMRDKGGRWRRTQVVVGEGGAMEVTPLLCNVVRSNVLFEEGGGGEVGALEKMNVIKLQGLPPCF